MEPRLIAKFGEFELLERIGAERPGWRNLKLVRITGTKPQRGEKRNWWFGWSIAEQRLADARDAKLLAEFHPLVYAWVIETLKGSDDAARSAAA